MYKVEISKDGTVTRNGEVIATITGFEGSDLAKFPNTINQTRIKLKNGERVMIAYGGILDGKFEEVCHIKCVWGTHCLQYKKNKCMFRKEFTDVGYYVIE